MLRPGAGRVGAMADIQIHEVRVAQAPARRPMAIRARALLAVLLLVPATVWYGVWGTSEDAGVGPVGPLFGPAVAVLFVLAFANRWLGRRRPSWAFTPAELVLIYVVVVTAGMSSGVYSWFGPLASVIVYPIWGASPSNRWAEMMWPNLPPWLTVTDLSLLEGYFLGNSHPYQRAVLAAWARPAFWWAAWTTGLLWVSLCLNVIVRRRWSDEDKLAFPMTELPLQLTQPDGRLFQSRAWWIGLGVSLGVGFWNLLGIFCPALPGVPLSVDISNRIATGIWSALRCTRVSWGFWEIGLAYVMPLDMMISLVVFNLLWRSEYLLSRMLGWNISAWSGFPYGDEQSIGAYLAVLATVLWMDRRYLGQVLRKVVGLPSAADDRREPFSYRFACLGALLGGWFLTWLFTHAGVRAPVAVAFLGLYFAMMLVLSRLRAQIGPPDNEMYGAMPPYLLSQFPGTRWLGPRGVSMTTLMAPFVHEQTNNPSPVQLEALRMSENRKMSPRLLSVLMIAVVPIIVLVYFWAQLHFGYHRGLEAGWNVRFVQMSRNSAQTLGALLQNPEPANWSGTQAIGVGAVITVALDGRQTALPRVATASGSLSTRLELSH